MKPEGTESNDRKLADSLAEAVDEAGVDQRVLDAMTNMNPEAFEAAQENIRQWLALMLTKP
jgi:hypothetical protein